MSGPIFVCLYSIWLSHPCLVLSVFVSTVFDAVTSVRFYLFVSTVFDLVISVWFYVFVSTVFDADTSVRFNLSLSLQYLTWSPVSGSTCVCTVVDLVTSVWFYLCLYSSWSSHQCMVLANFVFANIWHEFTANLGSDGFWGCHSVSGLELIFFFSISVSRNTALELVRRTNTSRMSQQRSTSKELGTFLFLFFDICVILINRMRHFEFLSYLCHCNLCLFWFLKLHLA